MLMVMAKRTKTTKSNTATTRDTSSLDLTRLTRTVYFLLVVFAVSIMIFDSGNLITRDAVVERWTIFSALLVINTAIWVSASQTSQVGFRSLATYISALSVLGFAGLMTYAERGMASTSTLLYALPLLIVATLKSRHSLIATAALSAGTYAFASVKYFNDFFNEGYRIQLWGSLVFYTGIIFTAAWLLMIVAGLREDSR